MSKRIWRDGKYREYPVHLSLEEALARKLIKMLVYSAGAHMGIPPAGYKDNYQGWRKAHGWKLDLKDIIVHQLKMSKIPNKSPVECDFCPPVEELMRREKEGYYDNIEPIDLEIGRKWGIYDEEETTTTDETS